MVRDRTSRPGRLRTDRGRAWLVVLLAVTVVAGAGVGLTWWTGALDGLTDDGSDDPTSATEVPPPAGLQLPEARSAQLVLDPPSGPVVDRKALRSRIRPLLANDDLGRHVGFRVYDLTHDRPLWTSGGGRPYLPASTLKLFTATAALAAMGGDAVFTTSTVLQPVRGAANPRVVLVGGGDPLLTKQPRRQAADLDPRPATVAELAAETARALRSDGHTRVALAYDDSLFAGRSESPTWKPGYVPEEVPPIDALWVDEGEDPADPSRAVADPARQAADAFAAALADRGITVTGAVEPRTAAPRAPVLAEVDSPPLREIVGHVLDTSDNAAAEVLLRHVALATDRPGSFAGGARAVRAVLADLGVAMRGVDIHDGSGLSRSNRVTLRAVTDVLRIASDADHPELRDVVTRLPVAGFTGTLAYRFTTSGTEPGLGWVRAKTGTLSHVHGLAGTVVDRDGVALAFVALVDRVRLRDTLDARATLDEVAAALASCGCAR